MTVLHAFARGWSIVRRAPALVLGLWLVNALVAVPFALALVAVPTSPWAFELVSQLAGLGQSLAPAFGALGLGLAPEAARVAPPRLALVSAAASMALIALFLRGGVLDRLARDRATGMHGFAGASGVLFFRILRLALLAAPVYAALAVWLLNAARLDRAAGAGGLGRSIVPALAIAAVTLWWNYASVRLVVEDRRSAFGALAAALRFMRRHAAAVAGVWLLNAAPVLLLITLMTMIPGGPRSSRWMLAGYLAIRVVMRLAASAAEIALFQGALAHAGYTARPAPAWPDSPAAEAIRPQ